MEATRSLSGEEFFTLVLEGPERGLGAGTVSAFAECPPQHLFTEDGVGGRKPELRCFAKELLCSLPSTSIIYAPKVETLEVFVGKGCFDHCGVGSSVTGLLRVFCYLEGPVRRQLCSIKGTRRSSKHFMPVTEVGVRSLVHGRLILVWDLESKGEGVGVVLVTLNFSSGGTHFIPLLIREPTRRGFKAFL